MLPAPVYFPSEFMGSDFLVMKITINFTSTCDVSSL